MKAYLPLSVMTLVLAGCATRPMPVVAVAEAPPPVELVGPPLPPGATPGMLVPAMLADGSFPTPNRGLSGVAATWHLRAGLNVAALSCPGDEGAAIRAAYNGWLTSAKAPLARVARTYEASYAIKAGAGSYDDAMTRLYNFFSQTPVRASFCAAAVRVAGEFTTLAPAAIDTVAAERLALMDQPFVDFYRAYDAWRSGGRPRVVIAAAAPAVAPAPAMAIAPPAPVVAPRMASVAVAAPAPAMAATQVRPRPVSLMLDLSSLPADTRVTAAR